MTKELIAFFADSIERGLNKLFFIDKQIFVYLFFLGYLGDVDIVYYLPK